MLIRLKDVPEVREEGYPLVLKTVINRDEHSKDISVTWVKIWGHHKKMGGGSLFDTHFIWGPRMAPYPLSLHLGP